VLANASSQQSPVTNVLTSESYIIPRMFESAVSITRRALSRQSLQILRECDVGSLRTREALQDVRRCRLLFVAKPLLLLRAVFADPSAALWLPIPVVVSDENVYTRVLFPLEAIVRDRACLLGIEDSVHNLYASLTAALTTIGYREGDDETW
jgi:hypothetical protein